MMSRPVVMPQASSFASEQTPFSGSPSFKAYESAIWNFDFSTAQLLPTWVNPDGKTTQKASTVHERARGTFAITENAGSDSEEEVVPVTFYFEPSQ
ncbi:hypothetical protein FRB90_010535 [Tulasnella sp. 427]|nr:hypothetical protein FRB90_010535 [Tulasnella sp. 427]